MRRDCVKPAAIVERLSACAHTPETHRFWPRCVALATRVRNLLLLGQMTARREVLR
jgi:hypothetical protein